MICGKLLLRPDVSRAYWKDADLGLTLGEYNIVHLLASNVGRYVTYRAIYDRLHYEGFIAGSGTEPTGATTPGEEAPAPLLSLADHVAGRVQEVRRTLS